MKVLLLVVALLAAVFSAGCSTGLPQDGPRAMPISASSISPLAGKWVGQAKLATGSDITKIKNALSGDKMTGDSNLTLNADGTGFLKVAKHKEEPISWKQEGQKVLLTKDADTSYVGTMAEDGRSMTIDMGEVKVELTRT